MALTRPGIDLTWSTLVLLPTQIGITLVLATLSYRFVEMPVRRGEAPRAIRSWLARRRPSQRVAVRTATAVLVCAAFALIMLLPVAPARSPLTSLVTAEAAQKSVANPPPSAVVAAARARPSVDGRPLLSVGLAAHGVQATIVSDSVGETIDEVPQAEEALTHGLRLRLELRICRRLILSSCTYQGQTPPPALDTIRSLGNALGPILIVDVGYNDDSGGYGSGIDQIMRTALAHGVREVIWLTLRDFGNYASTYQATNDAIDQAAHRWPQLRIADWNAYSAGKLWFADDVHPNPTGAVALAPFLRSYLTSGAGRS
jgi:hypothetical protein